MARHENQVTFNIMPSPTTQKKQLQAQLQYDHTKYTPIKQKEIRKRIKELDREHQKRLRDKHSAIHNLLQQPDLNPKTRAMLEAPIRYMRQTN
jgi:hypothetical protein